MAGRKRDYRIVKEAVERSQPGAWLVWEMPTAARGHAVKTLLKAWGLTVHSQGANVYIASGQTRLRRERKTDRTRYKPKVRPPFDGKLVGICKEIPAMVRGSSWGWGTWRHPNTVEGLIKRCILGKDGCLIWPGSVRATRQRRDLGLGQPQASLVTVNGKYRRPVLVRRLVWAASGRKPDNPRGLAMICGVPRCLNVEHMVASETRSLFTRIGGASKERRARMVRLYLLGLEHKRVWKELRYSKLAVRFGVTRERMRQILTQELGVRRLSDEL